MHFRDFTDPGDVDRYLRVFPESVEGKRESSRTGGPLSRHGWCRSMGPSQGFVGGRARGRAPMGDRLEVGLGFCSAIHQLRNGSSSLAGCYFSFFLGLDRLCDCPRSACRSARPQPTAPGVFARRMPGIFVVISLAKLPSGLGIRIGRSTSWSISRSLPLSPRAIVRMRVRQASR